MELSTRYNPKEVDDKWYKVWLERGYFHAEQDRKKKPYTIVIPPPNVTGSLHMGHALNNVLQDILIRWRRMQGYNACWVPGTDHGGIATQNVVEKILKQEGRTRFDLGREKFLETMWQWRQETGDTILMQLQTLGCSCDWERTRFTMDEQCSQAVLEAFVKLYKDGLIYRGEHIVDWCPRCGTALNESEVEHEEEKGKLWYIKYPLKTCDLRLVTCDYLVVATTRPETMLGDTAVAVNPKDKRYKDLIGKTVILPLVNRQIPVISDKIVEMEFGTGAVKITPAHDPNDWEIAKRHKLVSIQVIDKEGKITPNAGIDLDGKVVPTSSVKEYIGKDRYKARENIVKDLNEKGFLQKEEDYNVPITRCYRCNNATEPLISEQWYLKTRQMADRAMQVVEKSKTKFVPGNWTKPYLLWLKNLHDWCISRQIWWGHRIPAWYCIKCNKENIIFAGTGKDNFTPLENSNTLRRLGNIETEDRFKTTHFLTGFTLRSGIKPDYVGINPPEKCPKCNHKEMVQDPDVLDTWFSSALWPFSTLGWPQKTKDLEYFYPTSVLVTGHEIIYLWVARMIMMGLTLMGDVPFRDVYIHGIVRDAHGKKMSKSLGNVIDPLEITDKFGVDALRFTLAMNGVMGRDLQLSNENFQSSRNFCNKIWNASRFVLMNVSESTLDRGKLEALELTLADEWILNEYQILVKDVSSKMEKYDLSEAARILYEFIWGKYCDWYVELVKPRLYSATNPPTSSGGHGTLSDVLSDSDFTSEADKSAATPEASTDKQTAQSVLIFVLDGILKLLHPFMPFITEEIWQNLYKSQVTSHKSQVQEENSIMVSQWPEFEEKYIDEKATIEMQLVMEMISGIRNIRGEMNINPGQKISVIIKPGDEIVEGIITDNLDYISNLTRADRIEVDEKVKKPAESAATVVGKTEVFVPLTEIIDLVKERERLQKEIAKISQEIEKTKEKLDKKEFVEKAPKQEVERVQTKAKELNEKKAKLEENLKTIS